MKKIDRKIHKFEIYAGIRRAKRHADRRFITPKLTTIGEQTFLKPRNPTSKRQATNTPVKILAPSKLDLYTPKNYESFAGFILKLRKLAQHNSHITICFRDTYRITAAASLRLIAEVDHLIFINKDLSINCTIPPKQANRKYKNADKIVESALQQIGFFKAIGQLERTINKHANIIMWKQLSGATADGSLAANLLNQIPNQLHHKTKSHLYRGAIEAIANCVEHAYPENSNHTNNKENRWWMLVGTNESSLTIIICDLGVGIPETLPIKHPQSLLTIISRKFNIIGQTDADLIRASTFIKKTRTMLTHRGKGGSDIRSITENYPDSLLSIRSNRGAYVVAGSKFHHRKRDKWRNLVDGSNGREWTSNHGVSISGTLIEWTMPLKALES